MEDRVLYTLIDQIEKALSDRLVKETRNDKLGEAEVMQLFKMKSGVKIAGCRVLEGVCERGALYQLERNGEIVHEGPLASLNHGTEPVKEARKGGECGLTFADEEISAKVGDTVRAIKVVNIERRVGQPMFEKSASDATNKVVASLEARS